MEINKESKEKLHDTISGMYNNFTKSPNKKDPNYSTIGPGPERPLKKGDSISDILAKMLRFMTSEKVKEHKRERIDNSLNKKEQKFKSERTDELIEAVHKRDEPKKKEKSHGMGMIALLGAGVAGLLFSGKAEALMKESGLDKAFDLDKLKKGANEIKSIFDDFSLARISGFEGITQEDLRLSKGAVDPKQVYDYMISKGVDPVHAMGMLTNIMSESSFEPGALGDIENGKYTSGGLFQHHDERFEKMVKFVGEDWQKNWKKQIDFALSEAETKEYLGTKYSTTQESTVGFIEKFEKPKYTEKAARDRLGFISGLERRISDNVELGETGPLPDTSQLKIKSGESIAGGKINQGTIDVAKNIQASPVPGGLKHFGAINDEYHHHANPNSMHTKGLALDMSLEDPSKSAQAKVYIEKMIQSSGLSPSDFQVKNRSEEHTSELQSH